MLPVARDSLDDVFLQLMYSDSKMHDLGASLSKLVAYMDQVCAWFEL